MEEFYQSAIDHHPAEELSINDILACRARKLEESKAFAKHPGGT